MVKYEIDVKDIPEMKEYSIVAKPIHYGNYYLMPTSHFEFLVQEDSEYNLFTLNHNQTEIIIHAATLQDVDDILHEELAFLWESFAEADDNQLLAYERKIKYFMLANFMPVKVQ